MDGSMIERLDNGMTLRHGAFPLGTDTMLLAQFAALPARAVPRTAPARAGAGEHPRKRAGGASDRAARRRAADPRAAAGGGIRLRRVQPALFPGRERQTRRARPGGAGRTDAPARGALRGGGMAAAAGRTVFPRPSRRAPLRPALHAARKRPRAETAAPRAQYIRKNPPGAARGAARRQIRADR